MKNKGYIILSIFLALSVMLNCFFAFKYLSLQKQIVDNQVAVTTVTSTNVGNEINETISKEEATETDAQNICKYEGHWMSLDFVPELYIYADGTVHLIRYASKTPNDVDAETSFIDYLDVGYIDGDSIIITKSAVIYDPHVLRIVEEGGSKVEEYYFHDASDVPEDKWKSTARIATIESITDEAIKVTNLYSARTLDYIKYND